MINKKSKAYILNYNPAKFHALSTICTIATKICLTTTRHLLDYLYHQNYHRHIGIDFIRQTNMTQQINFTGRLEENDGATMFIAKKLLKTILNFS